MALKAVNEVLKTFEGIDLEGLDAVKLQNRVDSKFVFSTEDLRDVLAEVGKHYNVLDLSGIRSNEYRSLYFDTENDRFFASHHNGKMNRYKVRYRQYMDSGLTYFEVKFKNNKGRTVKGRKKVADIPNELDNACKEFLAGKMGEEVILKPVLWNSFRRITLAHKRTPERLTIDHDLKFWLHDNSKDLDGISIAELKQEKLNYSSVFMKIMRSIGSRPTGMSKYCIGSLLLREGLKHNNFKPRLLQIKKLSNDIVPAGSV